MAEDTIKFLVWVKLEVFIRVKCVFRYPYKYGISLNGFHYMLDHLPSEGI